MEKEVILGDGRLAFGEGVEVATENMIFGNNVLKSMCVLTSQNALLQCSRNW